MNSIIVYVIELFKLRKVVNELVNIIENDATQIAKDYLKNHGIKQSYVADKMGISETTLSSRLNGRLKFDANYICKSIKYFAVYFFEIKLFKMRRRDR